MVFLGKYFCHSVDTAVMEVKKSDFTSDVKWFCVVVDCCFFLVHHYFADGHDKADVDYIDLVESYVEIFVDI